MEDYDSNDEATAGRLAFDLGPAPLPARPVGGERHERAVEEASRHNLLAEDAIRDYFAELERQGVRLVEQPKCPECEGLGGCDADGKPTTAFSAPPCQRCGGSGSERMVALGEVERWIRERPDLRRDSERFFADEDADAFIRRFGGGER